MNCPNCGNQAPDGTTFCPACGTNMANNQPQQNQPQQNPYQQNPYQQNQYQQNPYQQNPYQQNQYQQYQQPPFQQNPYQQNQFAPGGFKANVKSRSVGMCIFLSIITCGIYGIIWMINLANDLNTASGRTTDSGGGIVFFLSIITCGIYMWYWLYKAGEKVDIIRRNNGEAASSSGVLYLILAFFGLSIVSYCLIQSELNKVAIVK